MAKLRVHAFSVSLDGFGAGPGQDPDNPLGRDGLRLHDWVFSTRSFHEMADLGPDGTTGVDDDFVRRGFEGIGATIMGRNMFGPIRGAWPDESWKGWWGDDPPYHHPVFVVTHHARDPVPMAGGTTFFFVTRGIESALEQATDAAGGLDVRLGGGVATVNAYLRAGLVDELQLSVVPLLLGEGERILDDIAGVRDRYTCTELVSTDDVTHVVLTKQPQT
jgi:dihydrofolate reductase